MLKIPRFQVEIPRFFRGGNTMIINLFTAQRKCYNHEEIKHQQIC